MRSTDSPRLADVAAGAGVSLATASRAMTGGAGVSEPLAARVRAVADQLGYVPNLHARGLAGGLISSIGLIVHEIGDPYFAEIASGVLSGAAHSGRSVQIAQADRDPISELAQVRALMAQRLGSIIVAGSGYQDAALEAPLDELLRTYRRGGGRVAVIGRHHLSVDAVLPDNVAAGESLAAHLLELGHRHIGLAAGPLQLNTVHDRIEGMRKVLEPAGVRIDIVAETTFTREGGVAGCERILERSPEVTAIVGLNDQMALGVLRALRTRGVRVPEDISVAGFDDITVAADVAPALTTVRIPMTEMGAQAAALTLRPENDEPRIVRSGHELIVRSSTAPPRAS